MAVSRATSWTNTTEVQVQNGAARVKAVQIKLAPAAAADSYLQIYNVFNSTPGTTVPDCVIYIPTSAKLGKTMIKLNLGGVRLDTGFSWFVSTTATGGTAATTSAPESVDVFWDPA